MTSALAQSNLNDRLNLFDETGKVKVEETRTFLDMSRLELASAFGVSADALREARIAEKTRERIAELAYALDVVANAFEGNVTKTKFWLNAPNPNFGGSSPKSLILRGRYQTVLRFIVESK